MPSISKIRFTNVVYDNGQKRFNDDVFYFDGNNGAIILENGGGKTVFIQCAAQAVLPHADLGERKIKETLKLDNNCSHIGIEWIIKERPRQYCVTAVTLYKSTSGDLASLKFVREYGADDNQDLENMPFVKTLPDGGKRPATKDEMSDYYNNMKSNSMSAHTFTTREAYCKYLENSLKIIPSEWRSILDINKKEGGVEEFFDNCATTGALTDNLLIPSIEGVIAGDNEKGFAKTFDEQRGNFKEYRRISKLIKDCDAAIIKLSAYMASYRKFHDSKTEFLKVLREAGALFALAKKDESDLNEKNKDITNQMETLNSDYREWELRIASLKIAELREKYEIACDDYNSARLETEGKSIIYREKIDRKDNIELLRYKNDIEELKQNMQVQKEALKRLDEEAGMDELAELLETNGRYLRGVYMNEEELLSKQISDIEIELMNNVRSLDELRKSHEDINKRILALEKEISAYDAMLENNKKSMDKIAAGILPNPKSQTVEDELAAYDKRLNQIAMLKNECQSVIKREEINITRCNEIKESESGRQRVAENEYIKIKSGLERLEMVKSGLLERLKERYSDFYSITLENFYAKEVVIKNNIKTYVEEKKRQKEELLKKERLEKRLTDEYADNAFFTADPMLVGIVENLANQFSYIKTGTEFIQETRKESGKTYEELLEAYPFWAAAVIVNDNEFSKLKIAVERHKVKLNTNLFLLEYSKAMRAVSGEKTDIEHIRPMLWDSNIDNSKFISWKEALALSCKQAEERRSEKEREISELQRDRNDIYGFYGEYPVDTYEQWERRRIDLKSVIHETEKILKETEDELIRAGKDRIAALERSTELEKEYNHIMSCRKMAREYIEIRNEQLKTKRLRNEALVKKGREDKELIKAKRNSIDFEERIKSLEDRKTGVSIAKAVIERKQFYNEVKNMTEIYGDKSESALVSERKRLMDERDKNHAGRRYIEEELAANVQRLQRVENDYKRKKASSNSYFDESLAYHESMIHELEALESEIREMNPLLRSLENKEKKLERIKFKAESAYEMKLNEFKERYSEPLSFAMPLTEAKELLRKQEMEIRDRRILLNKLFEDVQNDISASGQARVQMEGLLYRYGYGEEWEPESYNRETDYYYNRLKIVDELKSRLEELNEKVVKEQVRISKEKEILAGELRADIDDIRLREQIINNIERSEDYNALMKAYNNTCKAIDTSKLINQNFLKEHEEHVQQYINQLYTHVERVTKELKTIQHKTKVKTEEATKEIIDISIPSWDEDEAKKDLQNHINWILQQIEGQHKFKDENGFENHGEIKKFIEKSLKTKQLFQKVFKFDNIKIKARKVTNDNQVSSKPYAWEDSEKWSGGERWSKNMSLFLGILNYIAEKRQAISSNSRNSRCVILDNPFGKASSEHVLDPVFYIAKELGFQIIAVTAHGEGKFIHDYFPVVYSLRLREAEGGETRVMTKKYSVKHAYFKDRDPADLERLLKREKARET